MTVYDTIKRNRRIIQFTAIGAIAVAATALIAAMIRGDGPSPAQALAVLGIISLPPGIALISLDRRPSLLPAAAMAAVFAGFVTLELMAFLLLAIIWAAMVLRRPRPAPVPRWATVARPLLAASVIVPALLMAGHLDPVCTTTYTDGRVENIDPSTRGFESGWQLGTGGFTMGSEAGDSVSSTECSSNTVVWWEAAASLAASAAILGIARRWPTGEEIRQRQAEVAV